MGLRLRIIKFGMCATCTRTMRENAADAMICRFEEGGAPGVAQRSGRAGCGLNDGIRGQQ